MTRQRQSTAQGAADERWRRELVREQERRERLTAAEREAEDRALAGSGVWPVAVASGPGEA
jgi:hypothetical protein